MNPEKEYIDVMLDIETLGTKPGSIILSIGAVPFNNKAVDINTALLFASFYDSIIIGTCREVGLTEDDDTMRWWSKQSFDVRADAFEQATPLKEVLTEFADFIQSLRTPDHDFRIWGNSASFDLKILEAAYEACEIEVPWTYREEMCFRTLKNLFHYVKAPEFQGTPHNALCDAANQALHAEMILERIGNVWAG